MGTGHLILVDNFTALLCVMEHFVQQGEDWIFRGQADAKWKLESSLQREHRKYSACSGCHKKQVDIYTVEKDLLEMGKRELKAYIDLTAHLYDDLDLMAYIQHYGGVTRLLDFTDSFSVALFFAMQGTGSEAARVFCIKRRDINNGFNNRNERREKALLAVKTSFPTSQVISFAPTLLNERMVAQQGLFLIPFSLDERIQDMVMKKLKLADTSLDRKTFYEREEVDFWLETFLRYGSLIIIDIPNKLFVQTQEMLRKINVSPNTLFPGIDGICRSLNFLVSGYRHHSVFEKE